MARPKKQNADYFPHDRDMRNDPKVKALMKAFGKMGYAAWCFMLEWLAGSNEFMITWDDESRLLFSIDFDEDEKVVDEIIDLCIRLKLLKLEDGKLFSEKLINRFSGLTEKRDRMRMAYESKVLARDWDKQDPERDIDYTEGVSAAETRRNSQKPAERKFLPVSEDFLSDKDKDKDKVVKKESTKERKSASSAPRFSPPAPQQVTEYCVERGLEINSEAFVDFYESKGWKVGNVVMKDWKAAVRNWARRDKERKVAEKTTMKTQLDVERERRKNANSEWK